MSYYILNKNNLQEGPYSFEEIQFRKNAGLINGDVLVWTEGLRTWIPLSSFPLNENGLKGKSGNLFTMDIGRFLPSILWLISSFLFLVGGDGFLGMTGVILWIVAPGIACFRLIFTKRYTVDSSSVGLKRKGIALFFVISGCIMNYYGNEIRRNPPIYDYEVPQLNRSNGQGKAFKSQDLQRWDLPPMPQFSNSSSGQNDSRLQPANIHDKHQWTAYEQDVISKCTYLLGQLKAQYNVSDIGISGAVTQWWKNNSRPIPPGMAESEHAEYILYSWMLANRESFEKALVDEESKMILVIACLMFDPERSRKLQDIEKRFNQEKASEILTNDILEYNRYRSGNIRM